MWSSQKWLNCSFAFGSSSSPDLIECQSPTQSDVKVKRFTITPDRRDRRVSLPPSKTTLSTNLVTSHESPGRMYSTDETFFSGERLRQSEIEKVRTGLEALNRRVRDAEALVRQYEAVEQKALYPLEEQLLAKNMIKAQVEGTIVAATSMAAGSNLAKRGSLQGEVARELTALKDKITAIEYKILPLESRRKEAAKQLNWAQERLKGAVERRDLLSGRLVSILGGTELKGSEVEEEVVVPPLDLGKFRRMLKCGVPPQAVAQKMTVDGVDPGGLEETAPFTPPAVEQPPPVDLEKFRRMLKMGVPPEAVSKEMVIQGADPTALDEITPEKASRNTSLPGTTEKKLEKTEKRRKLHWETIPEERVSRRRGSIWEDCMRADLGKEFEEALEVALLHDFDTLFTKRNTPTKGSITPRRKSLRQSNSEPLIDSQRAMNGGIMLARFKMSFEDMKTTLGQLDGSKFSVQQLETMKDLLPTSSELKVLERYKGDVNKLTITEQYMISMSAFPRARDLLKVLLFEASIRGEHFDTIEKNLAHIERACNQVKNSGCLKRVFQTILMIGNKLNGTSTTTRGFKVSSLKTLEQAKSFDKKTTVLQYLIKVLDREDHKIVRNLNDDLPDVAIAARIQFSNMKKELSCLERNCLQIRELFPDGIEIETKTKTETETETDPSHAAVEESAEEPSGKTEPAPSLTHISTPSDADAGAGLAPKAAFLKELKDKQETRRQRFSRSDSDSSRSQARSNADVDAQAKCEENLQERDSSLNSGTSAVSESHDLDESQTPDGVTELVHRILTGADNRVGPLSDRLRKAQEKYMDLLAYFCEDPHLPFDEFFTMLHSFMERLAHQAAILDAYRKKIAQRVVKKRR